MTRSSAMGLLYRTLLVSAAGCAPSHQASPSGATAPVVRVAAAWARPSPAKATMGAAYLTLASTVDDRLLEVSVPASIAARAELHEVVTDSRGQMAMRRVDGISLPANREVTLAPGESHIMLVDLARPLVPGDTVRIELRFRRAGRVEARVPVRDS